MVTSKKPSPKSQKSPAHAEAKRLARNAKCKERMRVLHAKAKLKHEERKQFEHDNKRRYYKLALVKQRVSSDLMIDSFVKTVIHRQEERLHKLLAASLKVDTCLHITSKDNKIYEKSST